MATGYSGWDSGYTTSSSDGWLRADSDTMTSTVNWQTEENVPKYNGWDAPDNKG